MDRITIDRRPVGMNHPPFIIAEAGINHNGCVITAKKMIDVAVAAGVDAIKFQTFKAEEFCGDPAQTFTYKSQGRTVTEPMVEMFKRYEFMAEQWADINSHCQTAEITFLSTPQNPSDLELLLTLNLPAIKVGSDELTNLVLIRRFAAAALPLILSCGMGDLAEVHRALEAAGWFAGKQVALLLCTSQYPTPPEDVNILKLKTLRQAFPGLIVGFSDHTQGVHAAILATALGSRVFEKHFTLDHNLPGPDHWFSEDPSGLAEWVSAIKTAYAILGSPIVQPTKAELDMRLLARRSIVALQDIQAGEKLSEDTVGLRRPGDGLPPKMIEHIIGQTATRDIKRGQKIRLIDTIK